MTKTELSRRAFTLIELLVVISIIALLVSILLPTLNMAKEQAKKVTCASNLKAIGLGVYIYAENNDDYIPKALYKGGSSGSNTMPHRSYLAYYIDSTKPWGQHIDKEVGPLNLAYLHDTHVIDTPKTFYCDSVPRSPRGPSSSSQVSYHYDGYHDAGHPWPWNCQITGVNFYVVRVSYNYVPQSSSGLDDMGFPEIAKKIHQLKPSYSLCTDLIKDIYTLPHKKKGSGDLGGLNVLFSGGNVQFCNNPEAFDEGLWLSGSPNSNPELFRTILSRLK